ILDSDHETRYAKVVRPEQLPEIVQKHRIFEGADAIDAPYVEATFASGIMVLGEFVGPSVAKFLMSVKASDPADIVNPHGIVKGLTRLPLAALEFERRPAPAERLSAYSKSASLSFPKLADQVRGMTTLLEHLARYDSVGEVV